MPTSCLCRGGSWASVRAPERERGRERETKHWEEVMGQEVAKWEEELGEPATWTEEECKFIHSGICTFMHVTYLYVVYIC